MSWFSISLDQIWITAISSFALYFGVMIVIRLNGLRSLSKMSGHDFAVTVAIGSIVASTVVQKEPSIIQGLFAISLLLLIQSIFSRWRLKRKAPYLENQPILLMRGETILFENLTKAKITENDLIGKLREVNVKDFKDIHAVVLEQTGDISVLHGNAELNPKLLQGVKL